MEKEMRPCLSGGIAEATTRVARQVESEEIGAVGKVAREEAAERLNLGAGKRVELVRVNNGMKGDLEEFATVGSRQNCWEDEIWSWETEAADQEEGKGERPSEEGAAFSMFEYNFYIKRDVLRCVHMKP